MSSKQDAWSDYFRPYLWRARFSGVTPLQLLDTEWADGMKTAERVQPYLTTESVALEIGCGIGRVSRFVAPWCKQLCCTDVSAGGLRELRKSVGHLPNVSFHQTSGYDLSEFANDSVDCVYSFATFFHFDFELVVAYFGEIARVLRPGGVAIIEFKQCQSETELRQLLEKIRETDLQRYEAQLDKWRFVSSDMLAVVARTLGCEVIDPKVTRFTFKAPL